MNTPRTSYPTLSAQKLVNRYSDNRKIFSYVRIIRHDGLFIHEFGYSELAHSKEYFDKWCDENMFNILKTEEKYGGLTYFVS